MDNTIISLRTGNTTVLRLSTNDEICIFMNNIVWVSNNLEYHKIETDGGIDGGTDITDVDLDSFYKDSGEGKDTH